ncbi:MAG: hypothetical protein F4Y94_02905 [Chloroflexi bacterium]|nr:hypothetical protein [Chloroflexota bacterium]
MFDTRNAMQRLIKGGLSETQADAVVDVTKDATSGLATKDDLLRAMREIRMELYRAIALQTVIFTAIVAALTKL